VPSISNNGRRAAGRARIEPNLPFFPRFQNVYYTWGRRGRRQFEIMSWQGSARAARFARTEGHAMENTRMDIELGRLHRLGGTKLVRGMIDLFLKTGSEKIATARDGARSGDLRVLERAMHSLRSSAGNMGAEAVEDLATRLEQLAAAREGATLLPLLADLEEAFARAKVSLLEKRGQEP
jgi:HPt (histidine-containing phosphotransfer) domain-containing protein